MSVDGQCQCVVVSDEFAMTDLCKLHHKPKPPPKPKPVQLILQPNSLSFDGTEFQDHTVVFGTVAMFSEGSTSKVQDNSIDHSFTNCKGPLDLNLKMKVHLPMNIANQAASDESKKFMKGAVLVQPTLVTMAKKGLRFVCKFCGQENASLEEWKAHLQIHIDKVKLASFQKYAGNIPKVFSEDKDKEVGSRHIQWYKCTICDIFCTTCAHMIEHFKCHASKPNLKNGTETAKTGDEKSSLFMFSCTICKAKFETWNILEKHMETEHFTCNVCKQQFQSVSDVDFHKTTHYTCVVCSQQFLSFNALYDHKKTHDPIPAVNSYECVYCRKIFTRDMDLKNHKKEHLQVDEDIRYECKYCDKRFAGQTARRYHEYNHTGRPFCCQYCGATFVSQYQITMHEKRHRNERGFSCKFCDEKFVTSQRRKVHESRHLNAKPYRCDYCEKRFNSSTSVKTHELTHTGERPYQCRYRYCKRGFTTTGNRKVHEVRTHGYEHDPQNDKKMAIKPSVYRCRFCKEKFKKRSARNQHEETHPEYKNTIMLQINDKDQDKNDVAKSVKQEQFFCKVCKKSFSTSADCENHESTHGQENNTQTRTSVSGQPVKYECAFCKQLFSDESSCQEHVKIHVNLQMNEEVSKIELNAPNEVVNDIADLKYQCGVCYELFENQAICEIHILSHDVGSF